MYTMFSGNDTPENTMNADIKTDHNINILRTWNDGETDIVSEVKGM